jgi:hypothetical protein
VTSKYPGYYLCIAPPGPDFQFLYDYSHRMAPVH